MNAWSRDLQIKNVKMIPDGCGTFTRNLGMLVNKPKQGFGLRSWRYSAVINDGKIEKMFVEPGFNQYSDDDDPYTVSSPEHMNMYLQQTLIKTLSLQVLMMMLLGLFPLKKMSRIGF